MDIEWNELVEGKNFITDLGEKIGSNGQGVICRYAVWTQSTVSGKHQIVEVGNNLDELRNKYQISEDMIMKIRV